MNTIQTIITPMVEQQSAWQSFLDFFYDYGFIILLVTIAIVGLVQANVNNTVNKYKDITSSSNYTGAQVAQIILQSEGITDVKIQQVKGHLTDNYNPGNKTLNLSQTVYDSTSVVASSIAAHEVGHAIQHAHNYHGLKLRQTAYGFAKATSIFTGFSLIIALLAQLWGLFYLGIIGLLCGLLFQIFTLPVEFDASKRAKNKLRDLQLLNTDEQVIASEVLNAAALTYLAATLLTLVNILRLLAIANRRN